MKLRYFYLFVVLGSLAVASFVAKKQGLFGEDLLIITIPRILGSVTVLVAGPAIIVGLLAIGYRFYKKKLSSYVHMGVFSIVWFLLVWSNMTVAIFEAKNEAVVPVANKSNELQYSPDGCEYSVTFPGIPKLTNGFQPGIGDYLQAEYASGGRKSGFFVRAECIPVESSVAAELNQKETLQKQIIAYAVSNGLSNPEYSYGEDRLGKHVRVRGFKTIDDTLITFEGYTYVGNSSLISLYAGGSSATYPQSGVYEFFRSLKRK